MLHASCIVSSRIMHNTYHCTIYHHYSESSYNNGTFDCPDFHLTLIFKTHTLMMYSAFGPYGALITLLMLLVVVVISRTTVVWSSLAWSEVTSVAKAIIWAWWTVSFLQVPSFVMLVYMRFSLAVTFSFIYPALLSSVQFSLIFAVKSVAKRLLSFRQSCP